MNTKQQDTNLNLWVKNLDKDVKKSFYKNLFRSPMLWEDSKTKEQKRNIFNSYRKLGYSRIPHAFKVQIFVCALSVDPKLKIEQLFPDVNSDYMRPVMVALREFAQHTYSTPYVTHQKEQPIELAI